MTNLEWLRTLSAEELGDVIRGSKCNMCAYQKREDCPTDENGFYDCKGGFQKWLNAEPVPKIKPCPVCKGKMDIRWQHDGYYLVCEDCGLHFGLDTDKAEQGIIEGDYAEKEALIDDWNRRIDDGKTSNRPQ